MDKATSGVWLAGEYAVLLTEAESPDDLGAAVERALVASRRDVPHPSDWRNVGRQVLIVAGKKTWRTLEKGAVLTHVYRNRSSLRVTPTRNGGPTGDDRGFHELGDCEQTLEARASPIELARAVTRGLNDAV